MAASNTVPERILESIVARLISVFDELNETNCFLSDEPEPVPFPKADLFFTVAPLDSTFRQDLYEGGGEEQTCEEMPVAVTVWNRIRLDDPGEARHLLTNEERGFFARYKLKILRALCRATDWEPEDGQNDALRDQLAPVWATTPRQAGEEHGDYWILQIVFSTVFDFDIGS